MSYGNYKTIEDVAAGWGDLGPWILSVEQRLESRITALTAELEQANATARHNSAYWQEQKAYSDSEVARLTAELATERDVREKAEASARFANEARAARVLDLQQAERERDEHAKHRANLDRKNQELSCENERLVTYASGCQSERDTALARVKDLEADREIELQVCTRFAARTEAAESALVSARNEFEKRPPGCGMEWVELMQSMLSSAPSPAPCSGCVSAQERIKQLEGYVKELHKRYDLPTEVVSERIV